MTPRHTVMPDARRFPRFAGVTTFCRFPLLERVPPSGQPVDWAVYGIPFDGGVTYRPGARFGPRAVREASQYVKPYHLEHELDVPRQMSIADAGDAPVEPYSCKGTIDSVCAFALALGDPSHTRLLAVGGDHSVAYANIRATWQRRGRPAGGLALLHLDAHLDTNDVIWGERWGHGSPFARAIDDGIVDGGRMLTIGVRGPLNTGQDVEDSLGRGIEVVTCGQWRQGEGPARLDAFGKRLGDEEVYLTFDIDCVDPAFAPGTGTPCCGGFTSTEVLDLLRGLAGLNVVGADVVEVLPDRDPAGVTALLAGHVIMEILALAAVRAARRPA